ncbi:MAG: tetratricopeptide repeat protein, partial [Acidobacteriota bacterium]
RQLGILALRDGDVETAIDRFEHALSIDPSDQPSRYNLGLAYARAGRADEARAALARFDADLASAGEAERDARRAMAESRVESLQRTARARLEDNDVSGAIAALEEAAILQPTDVDTWALLLEAYRAAGDDDGVERAREQLRLLRGGPA